MSKAGYLAQRMLRMDYAAMLRTARGLRKKAGRSAAWLMADMARCAALYGAGYMDYKIAEMYRLTPAQRATQITRAASNRIVAAMNDKDYWPHFDDKARFNALFADQVRRAWIDLRGTTQASLDQWASGRGDLIGKPLEGSSGQGIAKYPAGALPGLARLREAGVGLLEECVAQHPALAALCPLSVNTLRIATLLGDKKQGVVYAYLRIGNGAVVDNVDRGGMAAPVDLETGALNGPGADKQGNRYDTHPMTGQAIPGTIIPYWQAAKDMTLAAMRVIPQVRFVAWDVAITPGGPVFIEGNSFPSHAIPQFAAHFPDGVGILPRFRAFIDF